jgi:hypothetical protein
LAFAKAKAWVNDDGTYKVPEVLTGYRALEKELGSRVKLPDDTSTQEERDAFAKKLGWTGEAKDYTFAPPADMPKELPYSSKLAEQFREWAIESRLAPSVAKTFHDKFVALQTQTFQDDVAAYAADVKRRSETAHEVFVKEWGPTDSATYKENIEASRRAFRDPKLAGLKDVLIANGMLTPEGYFTSFEVGHLLANHGKQFLNDNVIEPNSSGNVALDNPFLRKLPDGKENPAFNMTEAGRLINQNPDKARRLILAAGGNPTEFGLAA